MWLNMTRAKTSAIKSASDQCDGDETSLWLPNVPQQRHSEAQQDSAAAAAAGGGRGGT